MLTDERNRSFAFQVNLSFEKKMMQCAPYIKNLCQTLNGSVAVEDQKLPAVPDAAPQTSEVSLTSFQTPDCIFKGREALPANGTILSEGKNAAYVNASDARNQHAVVVAHAVASCSIGGGFGGASNGSCVVKHVIARKGTVVPVVCQTNSLKNPRGGIVAQRRAIIGSFSSGASAMGSLPNLAPGCQNLADLNVKIRSGSFTESTAKVNGSSNDSSNAPCTTKSTGDYPNTEAASIAVSNGDGSLRFTGSTFVGGGSGSPQLCLINRKLVGYNSLTRPKTNNYSHISVSPTLNGGISSGISSSSSSAVSLSEISEECVPQSSSSKISLCYAPEPETSFCTALHTTSPSLRLLSSFTGSTEKKIVSPVPVRRLVVANGCIASSDPGGPSRCLDEDHAKSSSCSSSVVTSR